MLGGDGRSVWHQATVPDGWGHVGGEGEGGVCQTQPTKFTTFASEKYFVNRSSSVPSVEGSWTEI